MSEEVRREYSNGEITVVWLPAKCIHITYCWKELPEVFDPKKRPWVNVNGASTERIIKQVERCPSGALTYYYNNDKKETMEDVKKPTVSVEMAPDGPLMVSGSLLVKRKDGSTESKSGTTAFCRCGKTKNAPYCDGSHVTNNFKG
ncbi:putative Fe-S cluster protein YjdI [Dysgonomonadaceae bacterium PH5-43]|nr:putative Fe-S cluster protein YjdI [Dysgonomonadaceae bacterium PH5-43]